VESGNDGEKKALEVRVAAKAERRRFTADYNPKVIGEADKCQKKAGEIGALLKTGEIVLVQSQ